MPNLPVQSQTVVTTQDNSTGVVDYLKYVGGKLVSSDAKNYGIGSSFKIVANAFINGDAYPDLIAQNAAGQVDFLFLNASGDLIGSALSTQAVPHIVGIGYFGSMAGGQVAPTIISQLPNGSLDALGYNDSGQLVASDLIPNTAGLPKGVGVAESSGSTPVYPGGGQTDTIVTQLPDGTVDLIGLNNNFGDQTLAVAGSLSLPETKGSDPIGAVNQNRFNHYSIPGQTNVEGIQFVSQSPGGKLTTLYADSGYNDANNVGLLYASEQAAAPLGNVSVVDGGLTARQIFGTSTQPNLPAPTQTDVAVQDNTTGDIDYLEYKGNQLVASDNKDYGLGSTFKVKACADMNGDGNYDLVAQNAAGQVDFVFLNGQGNVIGSNLTTQALPQIFGVANDVTRAAGESGPVLMSQTSNGSIDALAFNSLGQVIASDLVPNTAGLAHAVGVAQGHNQSAAWSGGAGGNDTIVTQAANGSVDLIGLSGNGFGMGNTLLSYTSSFQLPNTFDPIGALNQNDDSHMNNLGDNNVEGLQFVTKTSDGHLNSAFVDSGFNDAGNVGLLYASNLTKQTFSNSTIVDGAGVMQDIFPVV